LLFRKEDQNNNSMSAAAPVLKKDEARTEQLLREFSKLDVIPKIDIDAIRPHVEKDPAQAETVLAILRGRSKRPPDNPTGFAITAFEQGWNGPAPPPVQPVANAKELLAEIHRQRQKRQKAGPISLQELARNGQPRKS
jgi:hypothetical protein